MTTFSWTISLLDILIEIFQYILYYKIKYHNLVFSKKPMFVFELPKEIEYFFNLPNGDVKKRTATGLYIRPVNDNWMIGYCCIEDPMHPDINIIHPEHKEAVPFRHEHTHASADTIIDIFDHFFDHGDSSDDSSDSD
jgi:hypothetical protein